MPRMKVVTGILAGLAAVAVQAADRPSCVEATNVMSYLDEKGALQPVRTPEDWAKRREHILAGLQLAMGPLPDASKNVPLDVQLVEETGLAKVHRKRISFATEAGDRVPAYLLIPKGVSGKVPGILCLHQTTAIGKGEPAGVGGSGNLHYALELAERGYVTLAPDYPNFGDYRLDPYKQGYTSATMKGIWNHMRAVDLLQAQPEVDPDRIGCIGHSLGGHNTLFLGAFDGRVKAMVSSCGFTSFSKYMGGDLTGWSHSGYMPRIASAYGKDPKKMPFDFPEVLAALAPRSLFLNAPEGDSNFDMSGVSDCVNAARPVYECLGAGDRLVFLYSKGGHDFDPAAREAAYAFLNKALKHKPPD